MPIGTSYDFYFADKNTEQEIFSATETNWDPVSLMSNRIMIQCMGQSPCNTKIALFAPGDTIKIGGQEFIVDTVQEWMPGDGEIRLNNPDGSPANLNMLSGNPITKGSANFTKISNTSLNGTNFIPFSESSSSIWYKIIIKGNESNRALTPIIRSIRILDSTLESISQEITGNLNHVTLSILDIYQNVNLESLFSSFGNPNIESNEKLGEYTSY